MTARQVRNLLLLGAGLALAASLWVSFLRLRYIVVENHSAFHWTGTLHWQVGSATIDLPPGGEVRIQAHKMPDEGEVEFLFHRDGGSIAGRCCYPRDLPVFCPIDRNWLQIQDDEVWVRIESFPLCDPETEGPFPMGGLPRRP